MDPPAAPVRPLLSTRFSVPIIGALRRQRVIDALVPTGPRRLMLLIAPAGAGKSTALASLAAATPAVTAWFRAEHTEADSGELLAHLEHALGGVVPGLADAPWNDLVTAASSLAAVTQQPPTLLLIDDLHELVDSPAEATLAQLIEHLPSWLAIVAVSRHEPGFNLPRLRVSGLVEVVPPDLLRWRHWEVEQLFRDFYREPLRPEDAARLTQRTGGWVAGLQLFHLASQRMPMHHRRALIDELHSRPGLVRDYLTRNVLASLPENLLRFLVDTCVLGRLTEGACNALREARDSATLLAELEQRRLFTLLAEDGVGYRYHEVLRSYLEISLLERDGPAATRARFQRAASLLEEAGDTPEAIHAYARAETWDDVHRLLGADGASLSNSGRELWLGHLPAALMASDPWLQLTEARALRADGQLQASVTAYLAAEEAFAGAPAADICRLERVALLPWADSTQRHALGATDLLRAALRRDPVRVANLAAETQESGAGLVQVAALLVAGNIVGARQTLRAELLRTEEGQLTEPLGRLLDVLLQLASGRPVEPRELYRVADVLEQLAVPWLARLARHLGDITRGLSGDEVDALLEISDVHSDAWGRPLFALAAGIAAVSRGAPRRDWLATAGEAFRELGAPVLQVWAGVWLVIAQLGTDEDPKAAREFSTATRLLARQVNVPGALALLEVVEATRQDDGARLAAAVSAVTGLGWALPRLPGPVASRTPDLPGAGSGPPAATDTLRCFGAFELTRSGRAVDIADLKPQGRQILGRLALRVGTPVQRERIIEDLWPNGDVDHSERKLQVLISTLRRQLEPDVSAGDWQALLRRGESYVLQTSAISDVQRFDASVAVARRANRDGDPETRHQALQDAYEAYRGDLLPELGSPDWLVAEREHYRTTFATIALGLVSTYLAQDRLDAAITVAGDTLQVVRYHSRLWEALRQAYERAGDQAAAARTAEGHAAMLAELDRAP